MLEHFRSDADHSAASAKTYIDLDHQRSALIWIRHRAAVVGSVVLRGAREGECVASTPAVVMEQGRSEEELTTLQVLRMRSQGFPALTIA